MALEIVRPGEADRSRWRRLFDGYAAFYKVPMDDAIAGRTWAWIQDPAHPVEGVIAIRDGQAVGLAHFRPMPNPLRGVEIGFLDDLFVDSATRGGRIGEALIAHVVAEGRRRGWARVRWLTADDNYRARTLYDRVATKTMWNTYEIVL
jgi:GNAT superfamily N-acetyltransferase